MKLLLFVEGDTEKRALPSFLKRWLDPRLPQPVGLDAISSQGCREYVDDIVRKVELNMANPKILGAVGLLDLYGLPEELQPQEDADIERRYQWAKRKLEKLVANSRFRQHFAVHETEAWLLSDTSLLPDPVRKALLGKCSQPEGVNFDEPPAKLLTRLYRERLKRRYAKPIEGGRLFSVLNPETAYGRCPHLKNLLDDLLALALQIDGAASRR